MVSYKQAALEDEEPREAPAALQWPLLDQLDTSLAEQHYTPEAFRDAVKASQQDLKRFFAAEVPVEALVREIGRAHV